jgi:hypothetical protein
LTDFSSEDVLFIGRARATSSWYRCVLPAGALGCDWITINPDFSIHSGDMRKESWEDYRLLICQLAVEEHYVEKIRQLRSKGATVLYDIDDYVFDVQNAKGHLTASRFDRKTIEAYERAMSSTDGIICSVAFLAEKYGYLNRTWVCRNGIDINRYRYTRLPHEEFRFGWAGAPGVGHREAMDPWMPVVADVLREVPESRFYSIGEPFALDLKKEFGNQVTAIPWCLLEQFPGALLNFDVGLAPAVETDFWRGKSDLRYLEYSAMGIATIGASWKYPKAFPASTPDEARNRLIDFAMSGYYQTLGEEAQQDVFKNRSHLVTGEDWIVPFSSF